MERLTHKSRSEAGYKANRDVPIWECLDKLGNLEDLQEQGRLLELENKYDKVTIGTEVFMVIGQSLENGNICRVNEWWNDFDGFHGEYSVMVPGQGGSCKFEYSDFGKTVFLTRKEGKKALKRMEDGNEQ